MEPRRIGEADGSRADDPRTGTPRKAEVAVLVLTRRVGEWIDLPDIGVSVRLCFATHGKARLGFVTTSPHRILRRELMEREPNVPVHPEPEAERDIAARASESASRSSGETGQDAAPRVGGAVCRVRRVRVRDIASAGSDCGDAGGGPAPAPLRGARVGKRLRRRAGGEDVAE